MIWPTLQSLLQSLRQPIDEIKDQVCEQNLSSPACASLSSLSAWMGGTHTQNLYLGLDDLASKALSLAEEARQLAAERRSPFQSFLDPIALKTSRFR